MTSTPSGSSTRVPRRCRCTPPRTHWSSPSGATPGCSTPPWWWWCASTTGPSGSRRPASRPPTATTFAVRSSAPVGWPRWATAAAPGWFSRARRAGPSRPSAATRSCWPARTWPSWPRSWTPSAPGHRCRSAGGGAAPGRRGGRPRRAGDPAGRRPVGADRPPGLDRRGRKVSAFRLAVSAEMVFLDLPFEQRVRRVADLGFEVEIWDWTTKDIDAPTRTGATFSPITGYVRGPLADPGGAEELLRTAEQSLQVAERLDCPRLNVHGTGLDDQGLPVVASDVVTPVMWLGAARTLTRLPELGERAGRGFTLENRNTPADHPGTPFAKAADTLALAAAVGSPHLRLNLDL